MRVPSGAIRLRFGAKRYYFHHGVYYHNVGKRYVVVRRPKYIYLDEDSPNVEAPFQEPISETIIIKNQNGSETPVRLESENGKWKGPNGELYDSLPTIAQLEPVYGLNVGLESAP